MLQSKSLVINGDDRLEEKMRKLWLVLVVSSVICLGGAGCTKKETGTESLQKAWSSVMQSMDILQREKIKTYTVEHFTVTNKLIHQLVQKETEVFASVENGGASQTENRDRLMGEEEQIRERLVWQHYVFMTFIYNNVATKEQQYMIDNYLKKTLGWAGGRVNAANDARPVKIVKSFLSLTQRAQLESYMEKQSSVTASVSSNMRATRQKVVELLLAHKASDEEIKKAIAQQEQANLAFHKQIYTIVSYAYDQLATAEQKAKITAMFDHQIKIENSRELHQILLPA